MINTLSISRELSKAGIKREQAEAIADIVAKAVTHQNGTLASTEFVRTHIGEAQKDTNDKIDALRVEISELRSDLDNKIASVREEIGELRSDMNAKMSDMNVKMSAMDAKISATETRLVRWVVGTGAALGIIQALIQLT